MPERARLATTDPQFLATAEAWLRERGEITVLICYPNAGGNRDILLTTDLVRFKELLGSLKRRTFVSVLREPQLPWRGIVDDAFIHAVLPHFPDRVESLLLDLDYRRPPDYRWANGGWSWDIGRDEQEELRLELEDLRGHHVAVGPYPPFWDKNDAVLAAYVPDEDGVIRPAAY